MIGLVCIDVDGTLVGRAGTIDQRVWELALRARDRGIRLAICSGRPAFGKARAWASRLDPDGWHVFQNGASVLHVGTGESRSSPLGATAVASLIARSRADGRLLELYGDTEYVVEQDTARSRAHAALLGVEFACQSLDALSAPAVRAQWLVAHDEVETVLAHSSEGLHAVPSTSPVMPETMFVNLTAQGVGKDSGVRAIAAAYGLRLEDVMVVGDALNDLAAMHAVGFPVAMGNAEPELLAMARLVVADVDAGGLAQALEVAVSGSD
jgi:Cof subfamily protein (haloacid dehalogenase superfamily)